MENQTSIYVGNGKTIGQDGLKIQLDLTQLFAYTKTAEAKEHMRKYTDKNGVDHTTINLAVWPLKEARQYSTHSVKVDTWKPDPNKAAPTQTAPAPQAPTQTAGNDDELPF